MLDSLLISQLDALENSTGERDVHVLSIEVPAAAIVRRALRFAWGA